MQHACVKLRMTQTCVPVHYNAASVGVLGCGHERNANLLQACSCKLTTEAQSRGSAPVMLQEPLQVALGAPHACEWRSIANQWRSTRGRLNRQALL